MAERRMFSKKIINSARFLRMPISCQALYFHLGLNADDDGVVEAYTVLRTVGGTEDDLRVLTAKNLIVVLNEDLVSYITDWNENNRLRADRKIDSIYKDLLIQLVPDAKVVESRPRADRKLLECVNGASQGQPMDGVGKDRIGKDSIEKDIKESKKFAPPSVEEISEYCQERNNGLDAESFFDFYQSKGWLVGNVKMKDWKAAVRTWEKRHKLDKPQEPQKVVGYHEKIRLMNGVKNANTRNDTAVQEGTGGIEQPAYDYEKFFS